MVTLVWGDGSLTRAGSWEAAERKVRALQWTAHRTQRGFRRALRRRAQVWSSTAVPVWGSSEDFLRGLERAGFVRIETDQEAGR